MPRLLQAALIAAVVLLLAGAGLVVYRLSEFSLPADPAERQEALQSILRPRVGEQMDRLNKRSRERVGAPKEPASGSRLPPAD